MKNVFLVVAALIISTVTIQAQEIDFGVQAGLNLSSLSGDDFEDFDSRTAINVGITGEYMFNESIALFSGLIYSAQGASIEEGGEEGTLKLDYLNVPILAKFYLGQSGFSIDAGPQVGFLINDELDGDGASIDLDELGLETKSIDFSVGAGLSYKFMEGTTLEGLALGARYMYGLTDIFEEVDGFQSDGKNSVLSVNLGYRF